LGPNSSTVGVEGIFPRRRVIKVMAQCTEKHLRGGRIYDAMERILNK
jgi:hypothetical protein